MMFTVPRPYRQIASEWEQHREPLEGLHCALDSLAEPTGLDGNVNYWTGYSTEYWKRIVPTRHYC